MRALAFLTILTGFLMPASATTLQQIPLEELARQSTSIVRAKVFHSGTLQRNGNVYTTYRLETLETLKSQGVGVREFAVPGGSAGGVRQMVDGAPVLRDGGEYALFLWTSRSGLTQIIGLSQGIFSIEPANAPVGRLVRHAAASEPMLDAAGGPVADIPYSMPWTQWKAGVERALNAQTGRR